MAEKHFTGKATAVAQVSDASIDSVDSGSPTSTVTVTIGGKTVSASVATGSPTETEASLAASLVTALSASTHPYFSTITWSNPSGGTVRGTAKTAGLPFSASLTATEGTTVTDFSDTTASAGPNDWRSGDNWSDGSAPSAGDDVTIANSSVNIAFGLDQSAVTLASLRIMKTYTGKLGLPAETFATSADGDTPNTAAVEYRETYLKIGATKIDVGEHYGAGAPAGSGRIKIDNVKAGATTLTVHSTKTASADTGKQALRYKATDTGSPAPTHNVFVREAKGGVGIGTDVPGETSTINQVQVSASATTTKVAIGADVSVTTFEQRGGASVLQAGSTVTTVTVNGGTLTIEGDFTITTLNAYGGTVNCNHVKSGGNAVTTLNVDGGVVDGQASLESRTWATVNLIAGTLRGNDSITVTTLNESTNQEWALVGS